MPDNDASPMILPNRGLPARTGSEDQPPSPARAPAWSRGALRRRQALQAGATLLASSAVLAGCGQKHLGSGSAGGVLPVPSSGVVHLVFQPNLQFIAAGHTTMTLFQEFVDKNFNTNPKYKGIWASVNPSGWGNAQAQIAATLAGSGYADIFHMCCTDIPTLEQAGIVAPLTELLRKDNIPLSLWSAGHILADSFAGQLYGLPSYDGTLAIFYRQDILDQLGLPYPQPDWTYADAERIWTSATGRNSDGSHRAGASFYWGSEALPFWLKGWGADYLNPAQDRATMSTSEGAAAVGYVKHLFESKVAIDGEQNTQLLPSGRAVFAMYHSAHVVDVGVRILGNNFKWNLLPNPIWPKGRTTFVTIDCYMLNRATKHPQETWTLLKWISGAEGDLAWPKFQIDISLVTPSLVSLWDYWEKTITHVAPPLRGKDLKWFYDAARKGYDYPQMFFRYQPLQADALVNNWLGQISGGQVSSVLGLQQMQHQVNALERVSAAAYHQQQALTQALKVKPGGSYPRPSATGVGSAAVAAPKLATLAVGGLTLTGTGAAVGAATDGFSIAAAPGLGVDATYTCRVTAIGEVGSTPPQHWAMAGLMARADLSDESTMIFLAVTRGHGLLLESRATPTTATQLQIGSGGLLSASKVTRKTPQGKSGYLLRPVWLRLQRKATTWTASTSLDGKTWTVAGNPVDIQMAGCWIGPFATAYNGAPGETGRVQARFDDFAGFALHSGDVWQVGKP